MKAPTWTKADEKRALKMGWRLQQVAPHYPARIALWGDQFKSDDEAIEWVVTMMVAGYVGYGEIVNDPCAIATIRKALFLCAKG